MKQFSSFPALASIVMLLGFYHNACSMISVPVTDESGVGESRQIKKVITSDGGEVDIALEIVCLSPYLKRLVAEQEASSPISIDCAAMACKRVLALLEKLREIQKRGEACFIPSHYHPVVREFCEGAKGDLCLELYNAAILFEVPELIAALDWVVARCVPIRSRSFVKEALIELMKNPRDKGLYQICSQVLDHHSCTALLTIKNPKEHFPALIRCLALLEVGCEGERSIYDAILATPALLNESFMSFEDQKLTSLFGIETLPATLTLLDLSKNFFIGGQLYGAEAPFTCFQRLEELKLLSCHMTVIPENFFRGLVSLKRLLLARNRLSVFPDVSQCPVLEMANLVDNPIPVLNPIRGAMSSLYFAPHGFTELDPALLRDAPRLRTLYLSNNLSERSKAALKAQLPNVKVIYSSK